MPISYEGKDYEFGDLVEHIKKTKPEISSPGGYVKKIEEAEHKAKLIGEKLAKITLQSENSSVSSKKKLANPTFKAPESGEFSLTKKAVSEGSVRKKESLANPKFKKITKLAIQSSLPEASGGDKSKIKQRSNLANPAFKNPGKISHPFNKMASIHRLAILSRIKGAQITSPSEPIYENLDLESRQGIDNMFNKERVSIIASKLASMEFSGSAKADTKKTGADVEKEKEKNIPGTINPFDFLGAKIREAVMSDFTYKSVTLSENREGDKGEKKNKQLGAPVTVTEPKKETNEFAGELSAKQEFSVGDEDKAYKIVRIYHPSLERKPRTIKSGLTLDEAQEHVHNPATRKEGKYFDAFATDSS